MKERLLAAFPHLQLEDCIYLNDGERIYVIDTVSQKSAFYSGNVDDLEYPYFCVYNKNSKCISLLCIDKCVYVNDISRCDCALFDEKTICFVEYKKAFCVQERNVSNKRAQAFRQLLATVLDFVANNVDFTGYKVEACACVGYKSPYPRIDATSQYFIKLFADKAPMVQLFEGNSMVFD